MTALQKGLEWPFVVLHFATNTNTNIRDDSVTCSEVEGLTIDGTPEKTGVTEFLSEACTKVLATGSGYNTTLFPKDGSIQDLTKYFARPVSMVDGDLVTGIRARQFFLSFRLSNLFGYWSSGLSRLVGVHGFRATAVFTFQVAATPFHQGLLALNFQPASGTSTPGVWDRSSQSATCTNVPHVRLDLASDTMVQLRVPYIGVREYSLIRNSAADEPFYGTISINTICPIPSVPSLAAPGYQLMVHMEDIELFGATPQTFSNVSLQGGKRLAPITEEFEDETYPFSSATMALSRSVKWLSKGIPAISSIGGPTSWFLSKVAGSIRSFGFSKPTITEPVMRVFLGDNAMENNVDVSAPFVVVGPMSTNTLRVDPTFAGTDVDEMSLRFVTSQWSQVQHFEMTTSEPRGSLLYMAPVSPSAMWFRTGGVLPACNRFAPVVADAANNSFIPSSLFFASSMFRYWRGSLKFRFTFAKTKMHGGRVMIGFNPYVNNANDLLAFGNSRTTLEIGEYGASGPNPFGYSKIFNLRDDSVLEFEVPYVHSAPYLSFPNLSGSVYLYVVDALQAPSMVSSSISVLVEVCAGDDFELADPIGPRYPVHPNGTIKFQAGKYLSNAPDGISEYTIGESIASYKQLISIPKITPFLKSVNTVRADISPWFYQPIPSVLTPAPAVNLTESFGYGGNIAACYAFVKGGTDFHVYISNDDAISSTDHRIVVSQGVPAMSIGANWKSPAVGTDSSMPMVVSHQKSLHVRLPAYQHVVRFASYILNSIVPTGSAWGINGTQLLTPFYNQDAPQVLYRFFADSGGANTLGMVSRSASDDASCGYYLGPPPLLLLSNNDDGLYDPDNYFTQL